LAETSGNVVGTRGRDTDSAVHSTGIEVLVMSTTVRVTKDCVHVTLPEVHVTQTEVHAMQTKVYAA